MWWRGAGASSCLTVSLLLLLTSVPAQGASDCTLVGKGACRGNGWSEGVWPLSAGKQGEDGCCEKCADTQGCTGFSVSNSGDCFLYGHAKLVPATALGGQCFAVNKKEENPAPAPKPATATHAPTPTEKPEIPAKKPAENEAKNGKNKPKDDDDDDKEKVIKKKEVEAASAKKPETPKSEPAKPTEKPAKLPPKPAEEMKMAAPAPKPAEPQKVKPVDPPSKPKAPEPPKKTETKPKKTEKKQNDVIQVESKFVHVLGEGGCRGKNWNKAPWPVDAGRKTVANCGKECLANSCTAFHVLHVDEETGTGDCFLFANPEVLAVKSLGGTCYRLADQPPAAKTIGGAAVIEEDDPNDEVEVTGPVHMSLLGRGRCRGPGWTDRKWPALKGFLSAQACAEACARRRGCTAFDLSERQPDKTFDCALYGHKKVVPASGVPGDCYVLSDKPGPMAPEDGRSAAAAAVAVEEEEEDEEENVVNGPVYMARLGKGRCRGPGWSSRKWPTLRGFLSAQACAEACARKKGCTAFDLSEQQPDKSFDCALYGHKKVAPASGVPGECFVLSDKPGVAPADIGGAAAAEEEEEDEEENVVKGVVDFHQVGHGRCRGPGWTFKKWPVIKGALTPKDCAVSCAKKKGCTAFDIGTMAEGAEECAMYGHKTVVPAGGVPGDCYRLGKSDTVQEAIQEEEEEEEEEDDGVKHKYVHLGHGMCRGANWQGRRWPALRGMKSLQDCANACGRKSGCTGFDISKPEGSLFDCMLYGHKHLVPAPGVPGECYSLVGAKYVEEKSQAQAETETRSRAKILDESDEDFTNIRDVELLGKGACRGQGWQDGIWPLPKGRKDLKGCAEVCKSTTGCVAFDLSNKENEKYDCLLLGHSGILPASGLAAKCYIIKGAKPAPATLRDDAKPTAANRFTDNYPDSGHGFSKLGSGLCRGPGWQSKGWPVDKGSKTMKDCAESCNKQPGCLAFDLSNKDDSGKFTCLLFNHKNIAPASALDGACYSTGSPRTAAGSSEAEDSTDEGSEEEEVLIDLEGDEDVALLGSGGCRGRGWQENGWPKVKGFLTVQECGSECVGTNGCTAFHVATPKDDKKNVFECFLFGHKSVVPATGLTGNCYTVARGSSGMVKPKSRPTVEKKQREKKYKIPEFDPPTVVEDVFDDDDDWLFEPPPPEIRSRDHIKQILGLEEPANQDILKITESTLKDLKKVYESSIKELEKMYKYKELSNRHFGDPEIFNKPLIVFMGPWSGGKSTIINYLLDIEYTPNAFRSSAEPSPGFNFNLAMYGDVHEEVDGTQLSAEWAFSSLQKFGQEFLKKIRGKKMPNKLLEKATFAEIPGVLETGTIRKIDRRYPFNDACQWFIDHADLIVLVYDYAKLDIGPETEALLDQLKGREQQVRILLNKADEITAEELLKIQGNLVWNVSPLMASMEPPTLYAGSFWSRPYKNGAPKRLLKSQEQSLLKDIREAIDKRVENRIATSRRFAVRVRNHAKMVDCYLTTFKNNKGMFGDKKKVAQDIIDNPGKYHIYEGLSALTNISRYDLPDPEVYRDFFNVHPLNDFPTLQSTCTFFKGCPLNKLDIAIAYDLPDILTNYKKRVMAALAPPVKAPLPDAKKQKSKQK